MRFLKFTIMTILCGVLVWEVVGDDVLKSRLYIPEAKQPVGFPERGNVGEIIIKQYPAYRAAFTDRSGSGQNSMFRTLFKHIKNNDIAMTAPVEMTFDDRGESSMAFLYRSPQLGKAGKDGGVQVVDVPAMSVVSVAVRGAYTKDNCERHVKLLNDWLVKHPEWKVAGQSRYFGYNSPFVPRFMRYGEVQIPVRR